jgi:ATP-binding cassette subfamily C protein PrsD
MARAPRNVVVQTLMDTRGAWIHITVFSAIVNVLMLTGSLYMMQVYDRVLASRSIPTLVGISLLALAAYVLQGWLDYTRLKMLGRIGSSVDAALSPLTLHAAMDAPLKGASPVDSMMPFRDLAAVRGFLSGLGPTALLDMPFTPLFIIVCFALHPYLGWLAICGLVMIVALTLIAERMSMAPGEDAARSNAEQTAMLEAGRRNAEAISALGMRSTFAARFNDTHGRHVEDTMKVTERTGGLGSFAKMFRFVLQSAVLGLGGYLVILGEMSGGAMLAASIMIARALAPVELAVSHLKPFIAAREGYRRLKTMLPDHEQALPAMSLPPPRQSLIVEDLAIVPPGGRLALVAGVSFAITAGGAVGLIGPSGSGKSTVARALVGIWPPARGVIRLDGAALTQWHSDMLGRAVGYLPQDVELFPGTISENIARFDPEATIEKILAATAMAGAHAMIVGMREGYDTVVGEGGAALSGGQRQRIALARALYGDPFLVVLDEPNSSLDAEGDAALAAAVESVKARDGIVVVITHRPSGLAGVDKVGLMVQGRLTRFGPRDEILAEATAQPASGLSAAPMREGASAAAAASDADRGNGLATPAAVPAAHSAASVAPSPAPSPAALLREMAAAMRAVEAAATAAPDAPARKSAGQ